MEKIKAVVFIIAFALSHHSRTVRNSDLVLAKMAHCVLISGRKEGSFNRAVFRAHCPGPLSVESLNSTWTTLWSFHGVSIKLCRRNFSDSLSVTYTLSILDRLLLLAWVKVYLLNRGLTTLKVSLRSKSCFTSFHSPRICLSFTMLFGSFPFLSRASSTKLKSPINIFILSVLKDALIFWNWAFLSVAEAFDVRP